MGQQIDFLDVLQTFISFQVTKITEDVMSGVESEKDFLFQFTPCESMEI